MQKYSNIVQDQAGNALALASVQVNISGGGAATIYSDNGVTVATNPITTASDGGFTFFATNGLYDLVVTATGFTFASVDTSKITLYDPVDGGAVTKLTVGSVVFKGAVGLTEDNANLFWDSTNKRLGIGTTTPALGLHSRSPSGAASGLAIETTASSGTIVQVRLAGVAGDLFQIGQSSGSALQHINIGPGALSANEFQIFSGGRFVANSAGPHAIGGATDANTNLKIYGSLTTSLWLTAGVVRLQATPAFVAGDKYVVMDANGNIHVSALGPAS
jgi:hypothetical protein